MRKNPGMVRQICADSLARLRHIFEEDVRLTLIAHIPGKPEAEFVLTDDDTKELRDMLTRSLNVARPEVIVKPKRPKTPRNMDSLNGDSNDR
jgi:hypothetical protein